MSKQREIEEIVERTRREANALPLAAARERRAQGLAEVRRVIQGTPLMSAPQVVSLPPGATGMRRMYERRR